MHGLRLWMCAAALVTVLALATGRSDHDFEFDEDTLPEVYAVTAATSYQRRTSPKRYVYDPQNSLCASLVCKKREVCLLRDDYTALCANKKELLRKGDSIVSQGEAEWDAPDDDVFYESAGGEAGARCVGCPARARPHFLCGSDNRTYSSLCRLDLHNCVRRGAKPVRLACRGFCPCRPAGPSRTEWRRRKSDPSHNEVLPERQSRRRLAQGSEGCALDKMANRLLDWFSVLMDEAGATPPPADGFPSECKPEVRWMFAHLDTDGDGLLSAANLYSLRHDERERCLRPFLATCGGAGAGGVSRGAWCGCLRRAARPCAALARRVPGARGGRAGRAGRGAGGAYVPACDARGFYRARQCHAALGVCWCVDPHGVELPGSRTKGAPACPGEKPPHRAPEDDEDGAGAGSGDVDLHF